MFEKNFTTNLLAVVHLWPAVPTAAKNTAGIAKFKSASFIITIALFPPNSKIVLAARFWTTSFTFWPISQLPVKETNFIRSSAAIPWLNYKHF